MLALHGHSTIEGKYFPSHRTAEVAKGQSSEQVRSVLGDPLEATEMGGVTTWRYFEKFYPRACTTTLFGISLSSLQPESIEAVVRIRDGVVEDVKEQHVGARR
jgi:outer membrane protein assembly factor BamE (lipoprotein component of BamABCDE complex)